MLDDLTMNNLTPSTLALDLQQFHDGFLDGFLIRESSVLVFLSTLEKEPYVIVANEVDRMKADDFREGNIIFDVITKQGDELSVADIESLYGTQAGETGELQARKILERVTREGRMVLEINPSCGCECRLIAKSVGLLHRADTLPV